MERTLDSHPKTVPWVLGKPCYVVMFISHEERHLLDTVAGLSYILRLYCFLFHYWSMHNRFVVCKPADQSCTGYVMFQPYCVIPGISLIHVQLNTRLIDFSRFLPLLCPCFMAVAAYCFNVVFAGCWCSCVWSLLGFIGRFAPSMHLFQSKVRYSFLVIMSLSKEIPHILSIELSAAKLQ